MVYHTPQADRSFSILESRSSEKTPDVFEPSSAGEESSISYEGRNPELSSQSLFDSSSFEGSDSSQEKDAVVSMSSDSLSDDLTGSIDGKVKVVSMKRYYLDDPIEGEEFEVDPVRTEHEVKETKKTDPMSSPTTVILLQHTIDKTDDSDAQEELETESRGVPVADAQKNLKMESRGGHECQRKNYSFFVPFNRHKSTPSRSSQRGKPRPSSRRSLASALQMKKRKGNYRGQSNPIHHLDSREVTDPALPRNKSSQGVKHHRSSQHFLASTLSKKKERVLEEAESYSSDDDDSREDTEDFTEDPDFEASLDSRCQPNVEWSRSANPAFVPFNRHKSTPSRSSQRGKPRPSSRRSLVSVLRMKKRKGNHRGQCSTIHHLDSREVTDLALPRNKSSQGVKHRHSSQHFLASTLAKKKERVLEEEESYSSDDDDSREDTEDFTEDPDFEASLDSRCQPNGEWSRSANPASSLAPSDWSESDSDDDQESESVFSIDHESKKCSKQARSLSLHSLNIFKRRRSEDTKSVKSKRNGEKSRGEWSRSTDLVSSLAPSEWSEIESVDDQESESDFFVDHQKSRKSNKQARSLSLPSFNMLKHGRSGDTKSVKSKRGGEDEDTKTVKSNKSWFRLRKRTTTPNDASELKSNRSCSFFRKPLWGRRNKAATLDQPQATTPQNPTMWEWFLEGFDNYCCLPLFCEAEDNSDEQSKTPSEIYVHVDTSKSLYTV